MGDVYDAHEALADEYNAGLINADGSPISTPGTSGLFDLPTQVNDPVAGASTYKPDPLRPKPVRGRYPLPHPETGEAKTWMRVSNLIKKAEDTYHLELWKQRNVAKGLAMRPDLVEAMQYLDVKADKVRVNKICERAQELAGAYLMSNEGTEIHKSVELSERADGAVSAAPEHHRTKVGLYFDALRAHGIEVVPDLVERTVVSTRYEVAGTFDNVFRLGDGSYVLGDKKTGDSLDLSLPAIAAQLDCYRDAINAHGVWNGFRYDSTVKVRDDFALVVHLPSTRDEVTVYRVDLSRGAALNAVCLAVREIQKVKAKHVAEVFRADAYRAAGATAGQEWLELANAAHTVAQLMNIRDRAMSFGQYTDRLADQFRILAGELAMAESMMGS